MFQLALVVGDEIFCFLLFVFLLLMCVRACERVRVYESVRAELEPRKTPSGPATGIGPTNVRI